MFKFKYIWPYILIVASIIFLTVFNTVNSQKEIKQNMDYGYTINKAGRQRMLSQLLTKLSYQSILGQLDTNVMTTQLQEWNRVHHSLQNSEDGMSLHPKKHPEMVDFFRTLNPVQSQLYSDFSKVAAGNTDKAIIDRISANEKIFLTGMENIVARLQVNSQQDLLNIRKDQRTMAILSAGFLLLLILLFVYPYHRKLVHAFKKVKMQQQEIDHLNKTNALIIAGINAGVWEWEMVTNDEKWSDNFYKLLGYAPGEIAASYNTFRYELLHPDDGDKLDDAVAEHLSNKTPYILEIRMRNKDGGYKWYSSSGLATWDENGKPQQMAGSIIDIQENVAYREELEKKQFLLEETSKLAKVAGWEYDIATQTTRWSQMMYNIHDIPNDNKTSLKDRMSRYPEEYHPMINRSLTRAVIKGEPFDMELELIKETGERKWIRSIGTPETDENGKIVKLRGIFQDIHQRKLRELDLAETRQHLEKANQAKDKIFSIISHDMKGPLNNLRAIIDMQKENIISREEFEEHIEDLKNTIHPLTEALDNILYWSQSQLQGFSVNAKNFNIVDIIVRTTNLYRSSCQHKHIDLGYNRAIVQDAYADPDHIFLIVRNLVNNAIKFTPEGGTIFIDHRMEDDRVLISIADTGIGMTKEELQLILQQDAHYTSRGTQGEKGTGLGIGMCYELAQKNNCSIQVVSEKGKGTTFTLSLPCSVS